MHTETESLIGAEKNDKITRKKQQHSNLERGQFTADWTQVFPSFDLTKIYISICKKVFLI